MRESTSLAPRWLWIALAISAAPMLWLALSPPIAFDETLYHLPFVHAIAHEGSLRFHEDLRFPVFPLLGELLAVPAYLIGGDEATHLVSLIAALLTFVVMLAWAKRRGIENGPLAAAAFLGAPIVVHLATSLYVDVILTFFVTLGFFLLDREEDDRRWLRAGLAIGAACAVKYLGLYFALVPLLRVRRWKDLAQYALGGLLVALPMYAWIYAQSGNPVFPFFGSNPWHLPLPPIPPIDEWLVKFVRIPWDMLFARDRIGMQPPFTPFFGIALVILLRRWSSVTAIVLVYLVAFMFLPPDCRYLVPLLPLMLIEAAARVRTLPRPMLALLAIVALLPGPAYAIYRIVKQGPRDGFIERNVPESRALLRADRTTRVYNCGGEKLKAYAKGVYLGDHAGLHSYARILRNDPAVTHENLTREGFDALLVVKRRCDFLGLPAPGFTLLYEDDAAQLWRVQPLR